MSLDLPPIPLWEGPWPPDPSWDDPLAPLMPPEAESPVPDVAVQQVAATVPPGPPQPAPQVQSGFPHPPAELAAPPPPDDADLIGAYEEPVEGDLSLVEGFGETTQGVPHELEAPPPLAAPAPHATGADYSGNPEEQARVAGLSNEDLALEQFNANQAAEQQATARRLEATKAERRGTQMAQDTYRQAMERAAQKRAVIDAEAERLATERVDPDGWRNSRSLFQTISMYVAGIVGGLVQSRTGGPNQGLAMINNAIEQHIDAQKANLAHRRAMLGDQRAMLADQQAIAEHDLATEQAFREGAYRRALEDIESAKQQFDPLGTQFRNQTMLQRQLAAEAAKAREDHIRAEEDRQIKIGEFDLKVFKENEAARHNQATEAAAAAKAARAGAGGGAASKVKQDPAVLAARYGVDPKYVAGLGPMTEAEFRSVVENARAAKGLNDPSEADKEIRDLAIGDPRKKGEPLKQADGTVYIPPSFSAKDLQAKIAAAERLTSILDEVEAIRNYSGGESEWANSDEYQRLVTLRNDAIITKKASTQGMSSDEDMQKIAAAVGVDNLTSFRSQAAKLKQARINVEENFNTELRAAKYTGAAVRFPNLHKKAVQTPDQREFAKLKTSRTGEKGQSIPTVAVASPLGAIARVTESAIRGEDTKLGAGDERNQIDSWAKDAEAGNAEARSFIDGLAADDTRSPAVRTYARGVAAHLDAADMEKRTGKKPGDKGFVKALYKAIYADEKPVADEEAEE